MARSGYAMFHQGCFSGIQRGVGVPARCSELKWLLMDKAAMQGWGVNAKQEGCPEHDAWWSFAQTC